MHTGEQNILGCQHRLAAPENHTVFQPHMAVFALAGEKFCLAGARHGAGQFIICIEDQQILLTLIPENMGLGLHIFLHILMDIQMIGCQVGDHCPCGAMEHIHQLEGAQLHHRIILRLHLPHQGQQRRANIAAQPHGFPIGLQHFRNQGGRSGFAVGTGHSQNGAGAEGEEHLHLRCHQRTLAAQCLQRRITRMHTGCAEHHIRRQILQICIAQAQPAAGLFQFQHLGIQLFSGGTVTAGDITAELQQQPHQGAIAHTQAQHGDLLALQGGKILCKSTRHSASSFHCMAARHHAS